MFLGYVTLVKTLDQSIKYMFASIYKLPNNTVMALKVLFLASALLLMNCYRPRICIYDSGVALKKKRHLHSPSS